MKNILYHLVGLIMLFSCNSSPENKTNDTINSQSNAEAMSASVLINRFAVYINGFWVKKDYIESIIKTKSPLLSYPQANGLTAFGVDVNDVKGDSLTVSTGWNNHEGGEFILKFQIGQNNTSLKITYRGDDDKSGNFDELGYRVIGKDTNLIIYHYDKHKKLIASEYYKKDLPQTSKKSEFSDAGYRLVNEILISGTYKAIDSAGNSSRIILDNNGNISGFQDFKSYLINIDFAEGYRQNLDEIAFDPFNRKKSASFAFKINADTLDLYKTSLTADSVDLVLGKLMYRFVKQR